MLPRVSFGPRHEKGQPVEKKKHGRTCENKPTGPVEKNNPEEEEKHADHLADLQNNPEETILLQEVEELEAGRVQAEARRWFAGRNIVVGHCISSYLANT